MLPKSSWVPCNLNSRSCLKQHGCVHWLLSKSILLSLQPSLAPSSLSLCYRTQKLQVMAKVFCNEELELKLANIGKHLQLVFAGEESVSELQDYVLQVHSLAATLTSKQVKSQQSAHTLAHQQYLHLYDAQRKAHENYLASATSDKLVALCGSEWIAPHQEMLDCMEQAKHLLLSSAISRECTISITCPLQVGFMPKLTSLRFSGSKNMLLATRKKVQRSMMCKSCSISSLINN